MSYDLQRLMLAVKGKGSPLNGIDISRYPVKHDFTTAVSNCKLVVFICKSYRYTGRHDKWAHLEISLWSIEVRFKAARASRVYVNILRSTTWIDWTGLTFNLYSSTLTRRHLWVEWLLHTMIWLIVPMMPCSKSLNGQDVGCLHVGPMPKTPQKWYFTRWSHWALKCMTMFSTLLLPVASRWRGSW
jgi:hypothetical protein